MYVRVIKQDILHCVECSAMLLLYVKSASDDVNTWVYCIQRDQHSSLMLTPMQSITLTLYWSIWRIGISILINDMIYHCHLQYNRVRPAISSVCVYGALIRPADWWFSSMTAIRIHVLPVNDFRLLNYFRSVNEFRLLNYFRSVNEFRLLN